MLNSYRSRAFLLFTLIAAEPAAHAATGTEPETMWDVLARIDSAATAARIAKQFGSTAPAGPIRRPLGVLPGFTVPATAGPGDPSRAALLAKKHSGPFGTLGDWFAQLEKATGTTVKMSGHSNLTFQAASVSGGADAAQAYQSDVYQGRGGGGLYTDTDLDIDATIFNSLHYKSHISNYLYGQPGDNKLQLDYKTKNVQLQAGDISAGFQQNSLISFSRYLTGIQLTNHWTPQVSTTILASQTLATPQTRTIQGANSTGPYYVFSGQIVPGSAEVRVDNRVMKQGTDYTLNDQTGELDFLNGNVILSTSTIAVTYETLGINQNEGSIYGFRSSYTPRGPLQFGITYLTEQSQSGSTNQSYTQQFVGNSSPLSPYVLDYPIDQTQPITVKVNGAPLLKGVDYTIDPTFPNEIRLAAGLPSTSTVLIQYVPLTGSVNPGNRTVLGMDGKLTLGRWGTASLETAMSGISLSGNSIEGRAAQFKLDLTPLKKLSTHITIKDIGNAFVGIESAGFNRNEKSVDISSDYSPTSRVHLNMEWEKAKRPSYLTTSTATNQFTLNTAGNDTYNQYSLGASYDFTKNGSLSLTQQSMSTLYAVGGQSSSLNDTLSAHYTLGKVGLQAGLSRNTSDTNSIYNLTGITTVGGTTTLSGSTTAQSYVIDTSTFSKNVGATWSPNNWFHLRANLSDNNINSTGTTSASSNSDARNADITSTFNLKHGITVEYGYALSDTGNLGNVLGSTTSTGTTTTTGVSTNGTVTSRSLLWLLMPWRFPMRDTTTGSTDASSSLGLQAGGGSNYNLGSSGNYGGFLGGGTNATGITTLGGRNGTNHLNLSWSPNKRIHTDLQLLTSSSLGDYEYNSNRNDFTFGLNYTPSEKVQFGGTFNVSRIAYTGGLGGSNTSTIEFHMDTRLMRKLNVRLAYQLLDNQSALNISSLTGTTGTTTGTTTAGSLTNTSANTSVLQMHLDYPVSSRQSLFLDITNSLTQGYLGGTEQQMAFGMTFRILRPLAFQLGWQLDNRTNSDTTLASSNYRTSSLLAQFGLQF